MRTAARRSYIRLTMPYGAHVPSGAVSITPAMTFLRARGVPYGVQLTTFFNPIGMPCWNPPFGTLSSYDLKTGKLLWRKPFGQIQHWGFYMPESWGTVTIGAPAITASGLIFIGASMDSRVRALDIRTGKVLWKALVDAPAVALPAVYAYKGKQYVVWAAGGNSILTPKVSDQIVAFERSLAGVRLACAFNLSGAPAANPVRDGAAIVSAGGAAPASETLPPASGFIAKC